MAGTGRSNVPGEDSFYHTDGEKYQFKTMPFGLVGAPAVFQRLMNTLLADVSDFASPYIDDVFIFSRTWEYHLRHLQEVLFRLSSANLTERIVKCQFGMTKCNFLGHQIGGGQIRPVQIKTEAVAQFKQPKTKKDVQSFLGLAGYYRRFIQNFATVVAPLTRPSKMDR